MIRKILSVIALTSATLSFAQILGVKGGVNISTISANDTKSKTGVYGGILLNFPITSEYNIQPEILYNGLGAKTKGDTDVKLDLNYISVPVMFQYHASPKFYFEAGPQFSYLVDSKVKVSSLEVSANTYFQKFEVGLGFGAGYYFDEKFGITARYVSGISNILKDINEREFSTNGKKSYNNTLQIGLAYKFKNNRR